MINIYFIITNKLFIEYFFLKNEILLIKIYLFVRMKYNKIHYSNNYSNKIKFNFIFFFDIL